MDSIWQDIRFGIRMLVKRPGSSLAAIVALALGIGASTAIFTVFNGVVLRPLPIPGAERLVIAYGEHPEIGTEAASLPDYRDWREQTESFDELAAIQFTSLNLTGTENPERLFGAEVTPNFFAALSQEPVLGRSFLPSEEGPASPRLAILSHGLWHERYGGQPSVIGTEIGIDGRQHMIVGVLGTEFWMEPAEPRIFVPMSADPAATNRRSNSLTVVGKLAPGVTADAAESELRAIAGRLALQYPASNASWSARLVPLHEQIVGEIRPALLVLFLAVGLLLLIACSNVANLLLSRAAARRREIAVRVAVGASRARIVRQLLVEGITLSVVGGVGGLLIALWATELLVSLSPVEIPRSGEVGIDWSVALFALGLSAVTGCTFGLVPALEATRYDPHETLRNDARSSSTRGLLRGGLLVAQVALALILLVSVSLSTRSLQEVLAVDIGFDPENLMTFRVSLSESRYEEPARVVGFFEELDTRIAELPGVESSARVSALPVQLGGSMLSFAVLGRPPVAPGDTRVDDSNVIDVSPDYFATMEVPLVAGRHLTPADLGRTNQVAVVNEAMVREYFRGEDPIGQKITFSDLANPNVEPVWVEIVGVVGNVRQRGPDTVPIPATYRPHGQTANRRMTVVVRTSGDPATLAGALRAEVAQIDPDQPVYAMRTMEDELKGAVSSRKYGAMLLGLFGAVALFLAGVGVFGVISYSVVQRTKEIGIRMAIGATRRDVVRMIVGQGMVLVAIGGAIGGVVAVGLAWLLSAFLFGVSPTDPVAYLVSVVVLTAVALAACALPARRATRVDPTVALRFE